MARNTRHIRPWNIIHERRRSDHRSFCSDNKRSKQIFMVVREQQSDRLPQRHSHNAIDNDLHWTSRPVKVQMSNVPNLARILCFTFIKWCPFVEYDLWAWSVLVPAYTSNGGDKMFSMSLRKAKRALNVFFYGSKYCVMPLWHCVGVFYVALYCFSFIRLTSSCLTLLLHKTRQDLFHASKHKRWRVQKGFIKSYITVLQVPSSLVGCCYSFDTPKASLTDHPPKLQIIQVILRKNVFQLDLLA